MRRDEEGVAAALEPAPQAIAERLLALATLAPDSERVVRRAWRSAQRLDAELDVLVVRPPGRPPSPEDRKRLEALRRLVAMLGARLRVEEGEDVAAVTVDVARELGSTYLLMGTPRQRRGLGRLGLRSGRRRSRPGAADAPAARAAGRRRADRRRPDAARADAARGGAGAGRRADAERAGLNERVKPRSGRQVAD